MARPQTVVEAVRRQDRAGLERALARGDSIPARAVVEAGRLSWQAGLALLRHGANPVQLAAWPAARALVIAAFQGEPDYVRTLTRGGSRASIFTAAALGDVKRVARELERDPASANFRDGGVLTPLHCCAGSRMGRGRPKTAAKLLDVARRLIDAGAGVRTSARSHGHDVDAGCFAIRTGQVDLLSLLLDHGLDPTGAVAPAAWEGRTDVLDLLMATSTARMPRA